MSSQNRIGLILALVVLVSAAAVLFSRGTQASDINRVGDVSVSCGPSQRAVVQQLDAGTSPRINVVCMDEVSQLQAAMPASHAPQVVLPAGYGHGPVAVPAVAYAPAPQVMQPVAAASAQPVSAPVRRASPRPSTEKRLLVIGGTAGAGAGIGALVGGRRGALIGAAIGAGGATIVDQVKHR